MAKTRGRNKKQGKRKAAPRWRWTKRLFWLSVAVGLLSLLALDAVVERALRINHTDPEIYLVMASNYFAMTQLQLAEQLVRQGLPLARSNSVVKRDLHRLLSQIISVK
ncbi:MAG: hypothetical protein ACI89Z_000069 [Porticoccus sp.]